MQGAVNGPGVLECAAGNKEAARAGAVHSSQNDESVVQIERLLIIAGVLSGRKQTSKVLVDSGATCNFVSGTYVAREGLAVEPLDKHMSVRMANGVPVECSHMLRAARFETGSHRGGHDFIVMPVLDGFDIVLGRRFLKESCAIVDHESDNIAFRSHASQSRKVKQSKPNGESAQFGALIGELLEGHDCITQDEILRAYGLTAAPVGVERVSTRVRVSPVVHSAVMQCVDAYTAKMSPKVGKLPPRRGSFDHSITRVNENAQPRARRAIPLSQRHLKSLSEELDRLLAAGLIRVSRSEWAAPVFFVPKNENEDRMVCDYRALNAVTVTNSGSLPHVKELFARLTGCVVFSKLDLKSGYHQLRIKESDIPLTGFITPLGHFEWLVMPFGEKNAPASFTQLMSQLVLPDLVHSFVIVYQDDILIASCNEEDHASHVSQVLDRLCEHDLWINPAKCEWAVREVDFLGHHVRATECGTLIEPIESKIAAVRDWPVPACTNELRSFLGLANFYRDFVQDFSSIAAPLTALTGQRVKFEWLEQHRLSFEHLKDALCQSSALLAIDDAKPFVLHCDASAFAIGAVLSQADENGTLRPVGFFSRKLTDTQLRWDVYEREIYSVVAALEHYTMHLKSTSIPVKIFTDHRSLEELAQQLLSPKMARWFTTLSGYNYTVTWIPATENAAADALSRRPDHDDGSLSRKLTRTRVAQQLHADSGNSLGPGHHLSTTELAASCPISVKRSSVVASGEQIEAHTPAASLNAAVSVASSSLLDRVRARYANDPECELIVADPGKHGYRVVDGLLMRHGDHGILTPANDELRRDIMREAHDMPTSGHMGRTKTLARISEQFYWAGMAQDVARYIEHCGTCHRNKHSNSKPAGLLKPLPIVGKGEMITMDFVGPLPRSRRGMNSILVVVDKLTKRAYYEACTTRTTARQAAEIVFRRVVREQGLPVTIVSDRDSRFTSKVWSELWSLCGTKLGLATAYHQQTDGQSERQVRTLEESLRCFVNAAGNDWDERLVHAEIAHNTSKHASTGFTPLSLHSGISAALPLSLRPKRNQSAQPTTATKLLDKMASDIELAKTSLEVARARQKRAYDRRRQDVTYCVGDWAYLTASDRAGSSGGKSVWKPVYEGPYHVLDVSEDGLNVTLDLPRSRRHPVFHVEKLKKASMPLNDVPQLHTPERAHVNHTVRPPVSDDDRHARDDTEQAHIDWVDVSQPQLHVNSDRPNASLTIPPEDNESIVEVEHGGEDCVSERGSDEDSDASIDPAGDIEPTIRRSSRQRVQPDRLIHAARLGDQLRLNVAAHHDQ